MASAISSDNPIYRRRRVVNAVLLFVSSLTLAFGLFWLAWILITLFYEGFNALRPSLFTLNTPPPGSDGGLLNAIVGSLMMAAMATLIGTPIGMLAGTYLAEFGRRGIEPERLVFRGGTSRQEHLAGYAEIDIALDTFPTNGGVTTCETLFMGVPTVALLGRSPAGRVSAAILAAIGLRDWAAPDVDAYVALAAERAGDVRGLAALRVDLRRRFLASPVGDPGAYTRAVEAAYRDMWRRWCRGG